MNTSLKQRIFQKGSTTYYNSSRFFPKRIRDEVFTLYAYVRVVDDYVDSIPADEYSFKKIVALTWRAWEGEMVGDEVVDDFVALARKKGFEKEWIEAFLWSMERDLYFKNYSTMSELDTYIYGSAEVIGLMMARIMELPREADAPARMQGKAMQFLNFIRDVAEDKALGRIYVPEEDRQLFGILEGDWDEEKWSQLISFELKRYFVMQKEAEKGFHFIPYRFRASIKTAAKMYWWTAQQIKKNPSVVWRQKIKPSKNRIILEYLKSLILYEI